MHTGLSTSRNQGGQNRENKTHQKYHVSWNIFP